MMELFSTDSVPARQRLDFWQTVCSEYLGTVECRNYKSEGFEASLEVKNIGDLKICRFRGAAQTLDHKQSLLRHNSTDDYFVVLQSERLLKYDHGGHSRANRGGIILFDTSQPYYSRHPEIVDNIIFFLPRKRLESVLGTARLAAGIAIEQEKPSYKILSSFLKSFYDQAHELSALTASRISGVAIDLISTGFAETIGVDTPGNFTNAVLLIRAKAFIDHNLGKTGLSMSEVAFAVGVSVRRLQLASNEEGVVLSDWMWIRRLSRARLMLLDPAHRAIPIGNISYICGFADQAHFTRRFKKHFGITPRECRSGLC